MGQWAMISKKKIMHVNILILLKSVYMCVVKRAQVNALSFIPYIKPHAFVRIMHLVQIDSEIWLLRFVPIFVCIWSSYKPIKIPSFIEHWKKRSGNHILILPNKCGPINTELPARRFSLRCLEGVSVHTPIMPHSMTTSRRLKRHSQRIPLNILSLYICVYVKPFSALPFFIELFINHAYLTREGLSRARNALNDVFGQ